jgi:hypothetical protein
MIGHGYGPGGSSEDLSGDKILKCLRMKKRRGGRRRSIGKKRMVPPSVAIV